MINKLVDLIKETVTTIPEDVENALRRSYESETNEIARFQLKNILDNIEVARKEKIPLCQDTGLPIFYVRFSDIDDFKINGIEQNIREAVKIATDESFLRPNVVDPVKRENNGNLGKGVPIIHYEFVDGLKNKTEIIFLPKGSGSENMSKLAMLKPSDGIEGIKKFVIETVKDAGGKPCPPTILGVGIGGSFDSAPQLAKNALLRPINVRNPDPGIAELEEELKETVNELNIGPMGLGGRTTTLGVNIEAADTHTAMLPAAVNIQCWAARRGRLVIDL
ncbi:MAG: fumarate hydratase [Candidatus Altiarchaeales archaeon WOR_SM1_86-2]|nr:MAG: fumarate hydratase [Candidatus Altiarchaeales archaeon WOR_SM1_86-2]ODS41323.1 MAG: fumarate hydratase [Candidatus Altiarchaeales archaeon WOR_SM1_79]